MAKAKSKTRCNFGYGAIYLRKTKTKGFRWYIDYRTPRGDRVQKLAPLAVTAEDAQRLLIGEVRKWLDPNGEARKTIPKTVFKELAEKYMNLYSRERKKSWRTDQYRLEANLLPHFGSFELSDVSPLMVEEYAKKRVRAGVSRSTINRELTLLKTVFNKAIDWGLIKENPATKVRLFSEKDRQRQRTLTPAEETRLLSVCVPHLRPIVIMATQTGMRRGEILALRWNQVDLTKKIIVVTNTKGGRDRIIPINAELERLLQTLRASNGRGEHVFVNPRTGRPMSQVRKSFVTACKSAGIRGLRFHDLRHTFATRLLENGVDIITVKELLGHWDVRVTQRYTHPGEERKRKAVESIMGVLQPSPGDEGSLLRLGDLGKTIPITYLYSVN